MKNSNINLLNMPQFRAYYALNYIFQKTFSKFVTTHIYNDNEVRKTSRTFLTFFAFIFIKVKILHKMRIIFHYCPVKTEKRQKKPQVYSKIAS